MSTEAGKRITKKQEKENNRQEAITYLQTILKPGDSVGCILKHVAPSGMSRRIQLVICKNGEVVNISGYAARAMDDRLHTDCSIMVSGCGMDMGFNLVYNLGRTLFPQGFSVTEPCDKCQDRPGKDGLGRVCKTCKGSGQKPKRGRNGDMSGHDNDGGYALHHRWI